MKQSTVAAPALSPLNGKPVMLNFDGAEMSSDAGLTLLREVERLHLVKLAATIVEKKTRIVMTLPASCPRQNLIRLLFDALAPPRPA